MSRSNAATWIRRAEGAKEKSVFWQRGELEGNQEAGWKSSFPPWLCCLGEPGWAARERESLPWDLRHEECIRRKTRSWEGALGKEAGGRSSRRQAQTATMPTSWRWASSLEPRIHRQTGPRVESEALPGPACWATGEWAQETPLATGGRGAGGWDGNVEGKERFGK